VAKRKRKGGIPPGTPGYHQVAVQPSGLAHTKLLDPATAVVPLRLFLGVTFAFAGLQKLADPNFFTASDPGSIQSQLSAAIRFAAVPALARLAEHAPVFFGAFIALGEIAVGLGIAFGLWTRVAAVGGMALSLTFFLTVSFHTWPYYYGSDIVFLFAWTPFVLSGPGRWSLDDLAARRAGKPVAASTTRGAGAQSRRSVLSKAGMTGLLAAVGLLGAGAATAIGRARNQATTTAGNGGLGGGTSAPTATGAVPGTTGAVPTSRGTRIGPASAVPVGGAARFVEPATSSPAYALQLTAGHFTARSAICTHQGCTVAFSQSDDTFVCPCHGSVYDARTGQVLGGPAPTPLPAIPISEGGDGNLYVDA
jgi:thiosulfate dehydrogenase (quinone) large subunit